MTKLTITPIKMSEDQLKEFIKNNSYWSCEEFSFTQDNGTKWISSLTANDYKMKMLEQKLLSQGADSSDLEEYGYMKWTQGNDEAEMSHAESDAGEAL